MSDHTNNESPACSNTSPDTSPSSTTIKILNEHYDPIPHNTNESRTTGLPNTEPPLSPRSVQGILKRHEPIDALALWTIAFGLINTL